MTRSLRSLFALAVLVAIAACSGDGTLTPPTAKVPTQGDSSLAVNFLQPAAGAPAVITPVVSFWAVKGEDREAYMYYAKRPGRTDSTEFVRFRVRSGSLVNRPDGSPIAVGDSIRITMTLTDPARLIVTFAPAGLQFAPGDPARLKMSYRETDADYDDDGDEDVEDDVIPTLFAIWRRETPTSHWIRQTSLLNASLDEVETDVRGFTGYVIAW